MNPLNIHIIPRVLHFRQPAGTSRGVYTTRNVWYILVRDNTTGRTGLGECAPLPDLSCDARPDYGEKLNHLCREVEHSGELNRNDFLEYPSMLFGLETAFQHLQAGSIRLWDSPFSRGEEGIPINGLVWMGSFEEMKQRIHEKITGGFRCIKLKIGAIDFNRELELLARIREHFPPEKIELRVDANGAFSPEEAPYRLDQLAQMGLHSIEQPVRAGQWKEMAHLCHESPIPVALDEELIGINRLEDKIALLDTIHPQYIILKPSLHGGIAGAKEWITLAEERGIGWWITSALESNVGLNAIAQWCGTFHTRLPQGLGTGLLFTDNAACPLQIKGDCLWFRSDSHTPEFDCLPGSD